jgi:imidazolonepropionase-like amidohydrolase
MTDETRTAFVGATLIDGTGAAALADSAVVVAGGRVIWVGPAAALDRTVAGPNVVDVDVDVVDVVDVTGKYVLPGLMDANVHLVFQCDPDILLACEPGRYDDLVLEAAQVALAAGITTVFDTWGPAEALRRTRDRINAGDAVGSRVFFGGNIIGNDGPWSADIFAGYDGVLNPATAASVNRHWEREVGADLTWMPAAQVREAVAEYVATSGIDFVKYASSAHAHFRFLALSPDAQRAIVREAHAAGMTAQACTLAPEALKAAIEAGVDLLQHGSSTGRYPMPEETLELIVRRRLPCVVTLHTRRYREAAFADKQFHPTWRETFLMKERNAERLIEAGALIVHATDGGVFGPTAATSPWLGPLTRLPDVPIHLGTSHVRWHRAMIERGMAPMDALVAATRNVAIAYHKDDELGTVETGKRADLLVLDADPLDDPENYLRITHVVKDGVIVDRQRLPEHPILTRDTATAANSGRT